VTRLVVCLSAIVVVACLGLPQEAVAGPGPGRVKVEQRLNALHCDAGHVDGRFGEHTRSAMLRFQSRTGLRQTGRLDRRTRHRLLADDAPRCDRRPVPRGSGHGRRIVVSQRQNWVWLVDRGGDVVAQGGMVDNPKVLRHGTKQTGSYCGRPDRVRRNQDYGRQLWLDHFVRFAPCGVGFHAIPRRKSTGAQIHPDWYLGTNLAQSHGCLRLSRRLGERVWAFTARRTPVHVL
jgi:hypothetical protein